MVQLRIIYLDLD